MKADNADQFKTLADFAGKSVGAQAATTKLDIIADSMPGANAVSLPVSYTHLERDTIQQEVQYSAAVEALDAAGLTSRSSNVLPSGEGLALALELGLPEEETISLSQLPTDCLLYTSRCV